MATRTFASLQWFNFRILVSGTLISATGMWMSRIAQDWLVLTELSDHDGVKVGVLTALQFLPMVVLSPWAGLIADRFDRRRIIQACQLALVVWNTVAAFLIFTGYVHLYHMYFLALIGGVFSAVESPARMTFVSQVIPREGLPNAISLNASAFNISRMIGPATAGLLIDWVGTGWVFAINAFIYLIPILLLALIRRGELSAQPNVSRARGQIRDGIRYVLGRPDIIMVMLVVTVVSGLGLNFQLTSALMATEEFGRAAGEFGLLGTAMAIGALIGSLLSAHRGATRLRLVLGAALVFGLFEAALAWAPNYWSFAAISIPAGIASLTMITSANALVQVSTPDEYRGRVMSLYNLMFLGTTPLCSPFVGWVAEVFSARWALMLGAVACILAALVAAAWGVLRWGVRPGWSRHLRRESSVG